LRFAKLKDSRAKRQPFKITVIAHLDRRETISEPSMSRLRNRQRPAAVASRHVLGRYGGQVAPVIAGTSPTRADRQPRPRAAAGPSCRPSCPRRTPGCASHMSRPPARRPRPPLGCWSGGPRRSVLTCERPGSSSPASRRRAPGPGRLRAWPAHRCPAPAPAR